MKLEDIPAPLGAKDFFAMLHFLANQEMYEARLLKMEDMRERLNERINAVGDIKDIEAMRMKARAEAAQAEVHRRTLEDALSQHASAVRAFEEDAHEQQRDLHELKVKARKLETQLESKIIQMGEERATFVANCLVENERIVEAKCAADAVLRELEAKKLDIERTLAKV